MIKHYLNVCDINGADVEPVDVITFGSPCQDMSIAGKRKGIKHSEQGDEETTRSGLFYEAIRIIKEMRVATNGEYPKYAVWENVPGAFSSNKGWDFLAVLEALCSVCDDTVSIPEPRDKKRTDKLVWNGVGEIVGDNFSVCWRTLDAQYWGVPQRRKRIYLVADFNTQCAREVLFKSDSLRGNMPQSNGTGQETASNAVGSVDGSVGKLIALFEPRSVFEENWDKTVTKNALRAEASKSSHCIVQCLGFDMYNQSSTGEVTRTLKTPVGGDDLPVVCIHDKATRFQGGDDTRQGDGEIVPTITGDHESRITDYTALALYRQTAFGQFSDDDGTTSSLKARDYKDATDLIVQKFKPPRKYIIRRLMPVECARLQGFPDLWGQLAPFNPEDTEFWESVRKTHAQINGKKYKPVKDIKKWYDKLHNDSAEYKMWGNGIALPCAEYVLNGIAEQGAKTLGSLFDGSGGFPLAGAISGITPLWSSEVEPYPIAVTKSRFVR